MNRVARRCLVLGFATLPLGGCLPMLAAEAVSVGATGKPLVDHGADLVTGKDCRFIEGIARKDRQVCEASGSAATAKDFKGVF